MDDGSGIPMWTVSTPSKSDSHPFTWERILDHWALIEADFIDHYNGLNLSVWRGTWRQFATLVVGLINKPPTTDVAPDGRVLLRHTTRLGNALEPPRVVGGKDDNQ